MSHYFAPLSIHHYAVFIALLNEFRSTHLSFSQFQDLLSAISTSQIILLFDKQTNQLIGTGTLLIEQKFIHDGGKVAHIEDIVIAKKYRGQHFGMILVEELIARSKNEGCYKAILNCHPEFTNFYEKCGFSKNNLEMQIRF